ncbi:PREDICTED: uncharacterized protein LOC109173520 [Ipomoea nil]|uniref:uncharacterized protein LOC109173520 n=1 Tax=Ipomoea nil TaxID=35883 RepID=UPI0009018482|nr:PREDICTED: uncharacterized protein LOC109173520 [Ipomoea nil]
MTGGRFTWVKGRGTEAWVEERLDRAVANMDWLEQHGEAVVSCIYTLESDHHALFVELDPALVRTAAHTFKFESAWILEEGCAKVVEDAWRLSMGQNFQERLAVCSAHLGRWGGEHFRQFGNKLKSLRRVLERLKEDRSPAGVEGFQEAERDLQKLIREEEIFWKQRSKQLWLKHGDANTKYFHNAATYRHRRNTLTRVKD